MRGGVGALLGLNPDYIFRKCMYFLLAASSLFLFLFSFFFDFLFEYPTSIYSK